MNNNTSDEDKHDTNYIKNKYTNTYTRKLHNLWALHLERTVSLHLLMSVSHAPHGSRCSWVSSHPHSHPCAFLFDFTFLPFYFDMIFPVLFHFSFLMHLEQHTELDNLITMQHNLRTSAKGSNDANDVHTSLTSYEPNDMVFNELGNSQGSFSYITQSPDLDIDDTTLGKLLTEAHREHAYYRNPEGVSVSQSSSSVVFDRTRKPVGERNVDRSIGFGVTTNTYSAHSKFSDNTQAEKGSIEQGNLWEKTAQMHRLGLCLMSKDRWWSRKVARKSVITNSQQLEPKKNPEFYKKNYGVSKRIFVKFINIVLLRWRNYENSKVLPSIRSQDGSSSRTRILLWNYQGEYKNYKMK